MEVNDGFLILNKSKNCTSFDCVKRIKRIFNIKKVGHTGTLDPQVTGVLPMALGAATRFIQYLPQEKSYIGIIQLGKKTTTDDIHGEILKQEDVPKLNFDDLDNSLNSFRGKFLQIPPQVSSVHVNGERAYRKSWRKENFSLPSKEVKVESLILKEWDQANGQLKIEVNCSSGTYIRSIARDLGVLLKSEGCLYDLRRIKSSGFSEDRSIDLECLINKQNSRYKYIIPIENALDHLPKIQLKSELDINYWRTGRQIKFKSTNPIKNNNQFKKHNFLVFDNKYQLLGIGIYDRKDSDLLLPKLVLNAQ
tara:strand:+ start:46 stop:966 length:921 start_codon:yes stop_codon:yes gene_type:complete